MQLSPWKAVKQTLSEALAKFGDPLLSLRLADDKPNALNLLLLEIFIASTTVLSIISRNVSWVDRAWSIAPVAYVAIFCKEDLQELVLGNPPDWRLVICFLLTLVWGTRLTWNFARKGGHSLSAEDYRWSVVRNYLQSPVLFFFFDIIFIEIYLNVLLFLQVLPIYICWLNRNSTPFNTLDIVAALGMLSSIIGEAIADQQQWAFQSKKHALMKIGEVLSGDHKRGFLTTGLWRYSRHPNFFFEMSTWCFFYLFSVAAMKGRVWLNFTIIGPMLLILLFQGSTWLTESLSSKKYPAYSQYQKRTSKLVPLPVTLQGKVKEW